MHGNLSPFLIPLGGLALGAVAVVCSAAGQIHRQRLQAEQRLAMVARGMSAEDIAKLVGPPGMPGKAPRDPFETLASTRRTAIVLISSGIGAVLFFLALAFIVAEPKVLSGGAVGLVPVAIGIGFVIDYHLLKRDFARYAVEMGSSRQKGFV